MAWKPKNDIKFLIDINDNSRLFNIIGLLIVYSILSGFKNIYIEDILLKHLHQLF